MAGISGGIHVKFSVFGEKQINGILGIVADNVTDMRPAWELIRDDWATNNVAQFQSEGLHGGERWEELNPEYEEWKKKHFPGQGILRRTNRLFESLTIAASPDFIYVPAALSLTLGTLVNYGIYHGVGTMNMAQRRPVEFTKRQQKLWPKIMQTHIVNSGQGRKLTSAPSLFSDNPLERVTP